MTRPTPRTSTPRLPRSARERLARFDGARTHPSFLSVPAAYGVRAAGFEAVGDVMGCIAFQTRWEYIGSCGVTDTNRSSPPIVIAPDSGSTFTSYVRQLTGAYRTALDRLRAEAVALGADGVLGIDLRLTTHDELREVVALGTAVRSTGRIRPPRPFTTDLSGSDVAKLLLSGWVPVELHTAVRLALRHDDNLSLLQANQPRRASNVEVTGYSELRQRAAHSARERLRGQIAGVGADGALLSSLDVDTWHSPCTRRSNSTDFVGLVTAVATSVARFRRSTTVVPAPLTVLPVGAPR